MKRIMALGFLPPHPMQVTTIGLDLAKNVFQVHGIADNGDVAFNRALRRSQMLPFFARLDPCLVGIEACGTSHHWAHELGSAVASFGASDDDPQQQPLFFCSGVVAGVFAVEHMFISSIKNWLL